MYQPDQEPNHNNTTNLQQPPPSTFTTPPMNHFQQVNPFVSQQQQQQEPLDEDKYEPFYIHALKSLEAFHRLPQSEKVYTKDLDDLLRRLGETGYFCYPWTQLRELIAFRIYMIASDLYDELIQSNALPTPSNPLAIAQKALSYLQGFTQSPPFTLQRLCEILVEPLLHFKKLSTVMVMIERCLKVNSITPLQSIPLASSDSMDDS
mmetsp:Transcript_4747/g.7031  ORF Transcript_4747/g.7031 Transcript_4747/m.7031 type:complete len:206 (+) Transcript_4747:216-833(+)